MTHTPLPWHQHQDYASVRDATGRCVADCGSRSDKIAQEATRLIVRAVNCHDELLAACRQVQRYFDALAEMQPDRNRGTEGTRIREVVQDAIARAGENQ